MSADCTGQRSEVRRVNTAPCVPQNVLANVICSSNTTTVTWGRSQGAELYSVTASSVNGLSANCTSASTSCDLSTLTCGESYTITVKAKGSSCCSGNSVPLQVQAAPCLPLNIQSRMNCGNNTASVSWSRGNGALSFLTTLECSNGQTYMCRTNETGCDIANMGCGRTCLVKVVAEGRSCNSSVVTGSPVITAPCPNTGIQARLDCRTNSAVVSWTPGNGTLNFNATLQSFQNGQKHSCFTNGSSCNISSLQCGTRYNVSVTGYGQNCSACSKALVPLDTAPCVPTQVNVSLCCGSDTASVSWAASSGLVSNYIVTAEGDNGITLTRNSSSTSCNISGLACGQAYNVSVTTMSADCTGQRSEVRRVNTAPCPPQNVSANVQCNSGSVLVSWSPVVDASQFRVEMVSQSTGVFSCNSSNTQCSIALLPCGESFNVSVVALRGSCQSRPSSRLNIVSAPCTPQRANGTVDCVTNSAWVSWDVVKGAETYTVLAVGDDGQNTTCSSPNNTCNVPDLGCGKSYTFQVTASTAACLSPPSNSFQLDTAPCALSSIMVEAECQSSVIKVQWQRATKGNSRYTVTAEDQDRVRISCNSSASSCNLTNVQCGKEYTIIVAASSNQCSSLRSPPYKITTAPCQPSQVQTYTDCQSKAVFVSWEPSYVAQSYLLTAVSRDGHLKMCNTSFNNCTLTDLRCSNTYNVSILASNENCTSLPNTNVTFKTVPCEPVNVTADIQCNRTASLSWVRSTGAVAYVGFAQSENATTVYCQNTETSCTMAGLVCGTVYNFTVQATDGTCNSSLSKPKIVGAAPCPPAGLKVVPLCRTVANQTQILRASWSTVSCPNSEYLFGLKGSIQGNSQALFDLASYWTSRTFFEMPLPCGSSYSATIRAKNSAASSVESAAVNGTTVPCAPLNVTFSASLAVVAWNESIFARNYTAYGVTSFGRTKLCVTSQLQCSITNFSSGQIVVTARNAAGESEYSVPVLVSALRRR